MRPVVGQLEYPPRKRRDLARTSLPRTLRVRVGLGSDRRRRRRLGLGELMNVRGELR